jgi:predicted P-loop ATPase/GTPase
MKTDTEIAEALGIGPWVIKRYRQQGLFQSAVRSTTTGRPWLLDMEEVVKVLKSKKVFMPGLKGGR